ncbi:hypothetical protein H7169_03215, partial [Candidatus Gracilibacteria bacterium]|nr:hypothetical protein [Candidatus Gracilibacteria bacterium]
SNETAAIEILRSQWKTEDRIKELEAKIDALSNKTLTNIQTATLQSTSNTNTGILESSTGNTIIPISAKFLTRIITKVNLSLTKNNGIYSLYIFDASTEYSTYSDPKFGIVVIASRVPYNTWLKNFQAIDKTIYVINETKTYPFVSFYLNPPKDDGTIRVVMQVEAQTLLISIPKLRFAEFKAMMTKK